MRQSSLAKVGGIDAVSISIDREIASRYDDVKIVADNIDAVKLLGTDEAVAAMTNVLDNIDVVLNAIDMAATIIDEANTARDEAEAARDEIYSMEVQTGAAGTEAVWDNGVLTIPRGDAGPQGPQGIQGVQGEVGAQGPQGLQGIQGEQGTSITSIVRTNGTGAAGTTDTYTVTMSDASTGTFTVYNGSNGIDGNGITSVTRTNGTGKAGTTDTYTITFTDSTTTTFDVYNGANGTNGTNGIDGRGIVSTVRTSGTGLEGSTDTYTITYTDATTSSFTVYNGTDGTGCGDMSKSVYDTNNNGKVDSAEVADSVLWAGVTGKPSTFPPDVHNHDTLYEPLNANIQTHITSTNNPHSVTKAQVGLGDVDNTADSTKAVLSASKLTTARNVSVSGDATGTASFDGSADIDIVVTVTDDSHTHDGRYYTEAEIDNMLAGLDPLPTQTGNTGKYLSTDGTVASWQDVQTGSEHYGQEATPTSPSVGATWYKPSTGKLYTRINDGTADVWIDTGASTTGVTQDYVEQAIDAIDALPLQTGNSGKFLTTNGTIASWATVVSDHGGLTGLGDDDHAQYHNNARGDARYYKKAEVDTALGTKQAALVSGTNIKTINSTSILGSGNIVIGATGLAFYNVQDTILTSGTYTVPVTGKYRITAIGAGGAGGARNTSVNMYPAATGGGAGGTCIHEVNLTADQVLTISIGAGGVRGTNNTNGGDGGNTTVTGTGISLAANGGGGGKYNTSGSSTVTLAGGAGGTATGGNIANLTGGRGGNITSSGIFGALVTGGGGASLKSGAVTRGGDITLPSASGSASGTYLATGGGGCFFRGGDFTATTYSSTSFATGGAGTGGNGEDLSAGYVDTYTNGGNALNAISSPLIGKGGKGSTDSTTPFPSLAIGGATGGWSATASVSANTLSDYTLPLAGSGGVANSTTSNATTDTINTYFLGGGSGGSANNATNMRYSTRGGNGVVFIEYKG